MDLPKLMSFTIRKLFNLYNLSVILEDNRLVLVGENGSGKSTLVSILYYALSLQWDKLDDYPFKSISIVINNEQKEVNKSNIIKYNRFKKRRRHRTYPAALIRDIEKAFIKFNIDPIKALDNSAEVYEQLQDRFRYSVPLEIFEEIISELAETDIPSKSKEIVEFEKFIKSSFNDPIIFLPTYRRIERDLKKIFPDLEREIRGHYEGHYPESDKRQLELVEFGMSDVKKLIKTTTIDLSNQFRTDLESLTGQYLSNILSNQYKKIDINQFRKLSKETYDVILNRVDESILSTKDKHSLVAKIESLSSSTTLDDSDKLIAYFLIQLNTLHNTQIMRETNIRAFADICNRYLVGKFVIYNNVEFSLKILNKTTEEEILLESLSSGEKQIISIFAHLLLSKANNYFLIFDEPELSLSVPWQRTFLSDISNSDKCAGLIAVTHSPFIFENDLEKYAHSITEFKEVIE